MQTTDEGRCGSLNNKAFEAKRKRLEDRWGEGLDISDYRALERTFMSLAAEYKGTMNPRLELNLIDICKWRLERDKAVKVGDTAAAKRYTDMIRATMDSEAMKVGDSKPLESMRIDGLADRLEKAGMLKNGVLVLEGVIDYIQNDRGTFQMSRDAVDAMMLSMINAYRFNNGLSEIPELPEDVRMQDKLGEFMQQTSPGERSLLLDLGVLPGQRDGDEQ